MSKLLVHPNVLLAPVADGYVAFDTVDQRLYQLNPVAALLVELCDGSEFNPNCNPSISEIND